MIFGVFQKGGKQLCRSVEVEMAQRSLLTSNSQLVHFTVLERLHILGEWIYNRLVGFYMHRSVGQTVEISAKIRRELSELSDLVCTEEEIRLLEEMIKQERKRTLA